MKNHYTSKTQELLTEFDETLNHVRDVFILRYGNEFTNELMQPARDEYSEIIPHLPYIGGKQPFTQFIISTGWFLAMYRVLKVDGIPIEEIGELVYEVSEKYLSERPTFLTRLLGFMTFSKFYRRRLRKRAQESRKKEYPGDYVFNYVEGDGESFDYGVDYLECGSCKFLAKQGAIELAPYICTSDILYSDMLGWGLIRTMTLAEGFDHCDFRFKKGGETNIVIPKSVRDFIERRRKLGVSQKER